MMKTELGMSFRWSWSNLKQIYEQGPIFSVKNKKHTFFHYVIIKRVIFDTKVNGYTFKGDYYNWNVSSIFCSDSWKGVGQIL